MSRSKKCIKCSEVKPLAAFAINRLMRDGHLRVCKQCNNVYFKQHRVANIVRVRQQDKVRAQLSHNIAARTINTRVWRKQHPQRYAAHLAVKNAVKAGTLKPQPCWVCGAKALAHHPDYSRPLDVVWLCQEHHIAAHKEAQ